MTITTQSSSSSINTTSSSVVVVDSSNNISGNNSSGGSNSGGIIGSSSASNNFGSITGTSSSSSSQSLQPFEVPDAFGMVEDGIYRSSIPKIEKQFQFLKTLHLKTILFLSQEIILKSFASFLEEERIDLIELGLLISNRTLSSGSTSSSNGFMKLSSSRLDGQPTTPLSHSASTNSLGELSPHSPPSSGGGGGSGSSPKPTSNTTLFSQSFNSSSTNTTTTNTINTTNTTNSTTINTSSSTKSTSAKSTTSTTNNTISPIPPALQIINNISLSNNNISSRGLLGRSFVVDEIYNTKHCTDDLIKEALEILMNKSNHPIMVVCSSGIHLTGTVIGCLRKLQDWSLTSIFTEYECFAGNSSRHIDQQFIEMFDTDLVTLPTVKSGNLPQWFVEHKRMKREEEREFEEMMKYLAMKKKNVPPPPPSLSSVQSNTSVTSTAHTQVPMVDSSTHIASTSSGHHRTGSIVISQQQHGLHHHHNDHLPTTTGGPNIGHHFPSATLRPLSPSSRRTTSSSGSSGNGMNNLNNIKKSNSNDSIHHQQQSGIHETTLDNSAAEPPFKFTYQRYLMDKHCPLISEKSNYSASSIVEDEDD